MRTLNGVTYFGGFDVVVEIIPKSLDVRDALLPPLGGEMAWEEDFR